MAIEHRAARTPAERQLADWPMPSAVTITTDGGYSVAVHVDDGLVEVTVTNDPEAHPDGANTSLSLWIPAADARLLAAALVRYADRLDTPFITGEDE